MLSKLIPVLLLEALVGCGKKEAPSAPVAIEKPAPNLTQTPDVGKVEQVDVTAQGVGMTPGAAINEALKTAIMQVNGTTVDASSANFKYYETLTAKVDVQTNQGKDSGTLTASVQDNAFAESIVSKSNGVVSSFKVASITPPPKENGVYTVSIETKIAKFTGPVDKKIKIVVPALTSNKATFNIGGHEVAASEILGPIRQQMINVLTESGRFTVLDREFDAQRAAELNRISDGKSNKNDLAKIGQELSADLVWM